MKKKKVIYQHKTSGDLVIKKDDGYYFLDENDCLGSQKLNVKIIEESNEWQKISPTGRTKYHLKFKENDEIYFIDGDTDVEYHINDRVTLKPNISYPDGCRDFIIKNFMISDSFKTNGFEFVYIKTNDGRNIHISELIKL